MLDPTRAPVREPMTLARRVVREPLLHFLLLGALIFGAIMAIRAHERPTVSITAADIEQMVQYWQLQTQRAPTKAELATIIQGRIDEELLAREALRLGMDKDDLIIRRRLAQKMSFASEGLGDETPSEATLRAAFDRDARRYATPERVTLRHVFFSADRGPGARAVADAALKRAQAGSDPVGDPSLLPLTYADADPAALERDYGAAFVRAALTVPLRRWVGPVQSPFGFHLIRVEARSRPTIPPFEEVRDLVRENVLAEQRQARGDAFLRKLRNAYRVTVAGVTP